MQKIFIKLAKFYNKNPDKYMDFIRLEQNNSNKACLCLGIILSVHADLTNPPNLVEKYKPQFSDWGRYCQTQRSMEEQGWLRLFGI